MSLRDLFDAVARNPSGYVFFLLLVPALTVVVNAWSGRTAEEIWRWRFAYAGLVYAACIPGVFALTLNVYLFLFERQSIWTMNLVTQVLPVLTMAGTLLLIRRKIPFSHVPGFGKIGNFLTLIAAVIGVLWFVDRLRLVAITYVPFGYILVGFVALLVLIRVAWSRLF